MGAVSPTGKVPALVDGDLVVWDTLAIAEYVAETWPDRQLWPADAKPVPARSVCAEMHSGFTALRSHCPMNIEAPPARHRRPDLARPARRTRRRAAPGGDVGRTAAGARRAHAVRPVHRGRRLLCPDVHAPAHLRPLPVPPHRRLCAARARVAWREGLDRRSAGGKRLLDFEEPYRLGR